MKSVEFPLERVGVGEREFFFAEGADSVKDVESPAALFHAEGFERAEGVVALANYFWIYWDAISDVVDADVRRDSV